MTNIIEAQKKVNKELLEENENLKKQLAEKEQELNDYKNTEVTEQEEETFRQEALAKIDQILVEMRNRFPHTSKNIEQDLRKLISKPLRNQFMLLCYQYSLYNDYRWEEKENLEKVVERIVIDHFENTELATELLKDWKKWNERALIFARIKEGKEIFGRPAKDIILKDIIGGKDERINVLEAKQKELEAQVGEMEERVEIEQEEVKKFHIKSEEWKKWQTAEMVAKHDAREKELLEEIRVLKNNVHWLENKEQTIEKYKDKELPALPKQQKKSRLLKIKQLVSKVKEKTQVKFQTLIIQKSK